MLYIGWFKFHREAFKKALWKTATPEQKVIFITLLGMVNFSPNEWIFKGKKYVAESGQMVTSLDSIVKECGKGISIKNVRTALTKFKKLGFLAYEAANDGTLLTIVNWELYQGNDDEDGKANGKPLANGRQTGGKQVATIEERKEDQEGNKDKPLPKKPKTKKTDPPNEKEWKPSEATLESSRNHGYSKSELFRAIINCFDWHRGQGKKMVDWNAVVRNWMKPGPFNNQGMDFKVTENQHPKADSKGIPISNLPEPTFNEAPDDGSSRF